MSETPHTDQLEDSDFHKYGDDDAVPLSCYHRMTTHARAMEATANVATRMLAEAWEEVKGIGEESKHLLKSLNETKESLRVALQWIDDGNDQEGRDLIVGPFRAKHFTPKSAPGLDSENENSPSVGATETKP